MSPRTRTPTRSSTSCARSTIPPSPHPSGSIDPARDAQAMEDELILADLGVAERRLERLEKDLKKAKTAGARTRARRHHAVQGSARGRQAAARARSQGRRSQAPARLSVSLGQAAAHRHQSRRVAAGGRRRRGDATGPRGRGGRPDGRSCRARRPRAVAVCAKIELEIAQLEPADAAAFLADLGLTESGLDRVIRASYDLLGYISFFTVGEDECRAWSIPRGTSGAARRRRDPQRHRARLHPRRGRRLRRAHRARLDGRLPRSRRGPARRQGVHRPGRRHHQFPPRDMIKTVVVCEAQVPFVHGGAELHVTRPRRRAAPPRATRRARLDSVQVVSEGRAARARGGVAADRPVRKQRRADRSRHRHEVPDLLRAPPEQGHVADSSVPRDLRAVRHAVQRVRPHRSRRAAARSPDRSSTATCSASRRGSSATPATPRRASRATTAWPRSRCTIRRRSPVSSKPGPFGDYVLSVGRLELAKRVDLIVNALACTSIAVTLVVVGDGPLRGRLEALAVDDRRRRSRHVHRPRRRPAARRSLRRRARRRVPAVRRGLRLRHARSVSRAEAGDHDDRRRRPARVRAGRRERFRHRAGACARSRPRSRVWPPSRGWPHASATPATSARARSPGIASSTASSMDPVSNAASTSIVIPAYNEGASVATLVTALRAAAPWREILVVDDASTDDTGSRAASAGARVIRHPYNKGNGAAVKSGIRQATGDFVLIMDADGQHQPADAMRLVVASRRVRSGRRRALALKRRRMPRGESATSC